MKCLICNSRAREIFTKIILKKHKAIYLQCEKCGFVSATPSSQWLEEAYNSAITSSDLGLLSRNNYNSQIVERLLFRHFDINGKFLDYAGGYGVFTRLMRDKGFDFYHEDTYCENLFAVDFEAKSCENLQYELVTAFEFMEHTPDPVNAFHSILERTDSLLISTELIPNSGIENWEYLATETGQHISLYTAKSLESLTNQFDLNFYTNGRNLHLATKKNLPKNTLKRKKTVHERLCQKKMPSLLPVDYQMVRKRFLA